MKLVVTAATGHLGGAIVNALLNHPSKPEVIGTTCNPEKIESTDIEFRRADYGDKSSYTKALKGVDAVLLVSGMDDPSKRVHQHRNVIEAAVENGVQKIVYTSIVGDEQNAGFAPVVASNRQTESDIRESGLNWSIGRNGIYIEPDIEYVDNYVATGKIANCGGDGKCGYTTREEFGFAYVEMILSEAHNSQTYNLTGPAISQQELADYFNWGFGLNLAYESMTVETYRR